MKDFGLTDIFQLLGQQQKTGVLNLQEDKKVVQVLFDKGMVVGTNFPTEPEEEHPLGKRLIRGGLISPEQWKKAGDQHKEELISIEQALLKNGMVINEDLIAVIKLLTFETIYGLFKWKGGTFRFETTKVSYDPSFVEPLNAEYLLLDVLRMVDEWPLLAERIPTFGMVVQKVNPLATLDVLAGTAWAKKRTFQMEVIFELIDGARTIQEIMDLSFIGEFDTCKNLITLIDAGLVEPVSISVGSQRPKRPPLSRHLVDAGAFLLVGVLAIFLIFQLANTRLENLPLTQAEWKGWSTLRDSIQRVEREKTTKAREVFFLEENRYPTAPEEMVKQGLLAR
ncbi:MAG: DUF4388 domain-containing protein [Deltaproteobacteria bacterium]|nr:DUF4388 domain-containing protein [Deltaproteobacteria bacterium]